MSTYSSNLRLELITTGTQAGTWGNTTNVNLGSLVEQGIAGYTTVSVLSAAQAFTANNGATDEARAALIKLTTITTAVFAVYAPPVSKQYVIYNSSAYTATIYNSSITGNTTAAGTGIAIPAGKTMTLWSDGTNFYAQNTYFDSPTINTASLTSPTMTGTPVAPTATAGTNTTQVATTAFVLTNGAPAGSMLMWGTATPPTNWLLCNGAAVNRVTYATLFALLSTTYGVGDGFTTFNVPDFRDRMAIGAGTTYAAAATGGSATTTLAITNLPSHTHTFSGTSGTMNSNTTHSHTQASNTYYYFSGGGLGVAGSGDFNTSGSYSTSTVNLDHTHNFSGTTAATGSGTAFTNLPPYLGVYFIIKYI